MLELRGPSERNLGQKSLGKTTRTEWKRGSAEQTTVGARSVHRDDPGLSAALSACLYRTLGQCGSLSEIVLHSCGIGISADVHGLEAHATWTLVSGVFAAARRGPERDQSR